MINITTPLPHQDEASIFLVSNSTSLLHADMGTGKSYIALNAFSELLKADDTLTCLIVTPKSVAFNFLNEVKKHFKGVTTNIYLGPSRQFTKAQITITTYDLAAELDHFDVLILDEVHIIRNIKTLKFKRIYKIAQKAQVIWGLSGTPIVNCSQDYNAMQSLSSKEVKYLRVRQTIKLPDVTCYVIQCEPSLAEIKIVNTAKHSDRNTLTLITELRTVYSKLASKFKTIKNLLNKYPSDNFLVFSNFTQSLAALDTFLHRQNTKFITGDTSNKQKVCDDFQASTGGALLLASYGSGGVGINLTNAHHVILLDPAWNRATHDQAVARAHRFGLKHKLYVHILNTQGSIESWMNYIMIYKKSIMEPGVESNDEQIDDISDSLTNALCIV